MSDTSRLRWLCRRGMKELDVIFTEYLENYFPEADEQEQQTFILLLDMPDPDLFALLVGRTNSADPAIANMIKFLQKMAKEK